MNPNLRSSSLLKRLPAASKAPAKYDLATKRLVLDAVAAGKSMTEAARIHGIGNISIIRKWKKIVENGGTLQEFQGKPPLLSDIETVNFATWVNESNTAGYCKSESQYNAEFAKRAVEGLKKRNKVVEKDWVPSARTLHRFNKRSMAHFVVPDATTAARRVAETNVNNAIGFCAGIKSSVPHIDSRMLGNPDATQFTYSQSLERMVYCGRWINYMRTHDQMKSEEGAPGAGGLGFGIKYYNFITTGPTMGDRVYILANGKMPKDEIDHYVIPGYGVGLGPERQTHIVFSQTRTPTNAYYKWWLSDYLVPYVTKLRTCYNLQPDAYFLLQLDGELDQIDVFEDSEIKNLMNDNHIAVLKSSASRTAVEQPSDVGPIFRAAKSRFRKYRKSGKLPDIPSAFETMFNDVWKSNYEKFAPSLPKKSSTYYDHLKKAKRGIWLIEESLNSTVTPDSILTSFEKTGCFDRSTGLPNVHKMLTMCRTPLENKDVLQILKKLDTLVELMSTRGYLLDDEDFKGIDCAGNKRSRDHLEGKHRKGFMYLTDPTLLPRHGRAAPFIKKRKHEEMQPELAYI